MREIRRIQAKLFFLGKYFWCKSCSQLKSVTNFQSPSPVFHSKLIFKMIYFVASVEVKVTEICYTAGIDALLMLVPCTGDGCLTLNHLRERWHWQGLENKIYLQLHEFELVFKGAKDLKFLFDFTMFSLRKSCFHLFFTKAF